MIQEKPEYFTGIPGLFIDCGQYTFVCIAHQNHIKINPIVDLLQNLSFRGRALETGQFHSYLYTKK